MKLSDRLELIANEITKGETMADIGTDHGFLPMYLYENCISPKVIMADVSKDSLGKAMENGKLFYPDMNFDYRLGSGVEVLDFNEVDAVVIAGMGGILMTEILGNDLKKSHSFKKYILQPRNNVGFLRKWLGQNGFYIKKEQLVRESRFIWEVLTVVNDDDIYYDFPKNLILDRNDLTIEYLNTKLNIEKYILENLNKAKVIDEEKIEHTKSRIEYMVNLIGEVNEKK